MGLWLRLYIFAIQIWHMNEIIYSLFARNLHLRMNFRKIYKFDFPPIKSNKIKRLSELIIRIYHRV